MKIGIIGYGSMGKMLADKFSSAKIVENKEIFISNRNTDKLQDLVDIYNICEDNAKTAENADVLFICVGPYQIKEVLESIKDSIKPDTLLVSLNEAVSFEMISKIIDHKVAKVIPSLTAEINRSETLVSYNEQVPEQDKETLKSLLSCIGNVYELPEDQLAIASDLVSCMPGFIAALFDVFAYCAMGYALMDKKQIIKMLLNTLDASSTLINSKGLTFDQVVRRVATPGGITIEGTNIIYEKFPDIVDEIYQKTLQKGKDTAERISKNF